MYRRRKRKFAGQWLPLKINPFNTSNTGGGGTLGEQNTAFTVTSQNHNVSNNANTGATAIPLTIADQPNLLLPGSAAALVPSFNAQNAADVQGYGYSLRRVVGCIYVVTAPSINTQAGTPSVVNVGVGLMVRAVDPTNLPDEPAISGSQGEAFDPLTYDNNQDPWIWRRSYLMCPGNAGGTFNPIGAADEWAQFNSVFQPTNAVNTGVNNTASIDQKTRRTVKNEERLFLSFSARMVGLNPDDQAGTAEIGLGIFADLRLFGRMFTTKGNRRNASR